MKSCGLNPGKMHLLVPFFINLSDKRIRGSSPVVSDHKGSPAPPVNRVGH